MEPEEKRQGIMQFLDRSKLVLYTVLEFLDQQDLTNLYIHIKQEIPNQQSPILALIQGYIYIRLHMNHTDRSFHFFVYESPAFRRIQKSTIAFQIASTDQFSQFFHIRKSIQQFLCQNLKGSDCQQVGQQIGRLSDDPGIPMQKLLRETVGIGCKSTFQNYLVSMHVDGYTPPWKEYPKLSEFYQKRSEQAYIKQFLKIGKSKYRSKDFENIKKLHFSAYLVNCEQFNKYLLSDSNEMHNLIVGLFAMADLTVKSTVAYLSNIKDPFYLLLEFCLRYALYRNFIIEVQEKFAFVFESYSYIYNETFQSEKIAVPKFTFWRPALSKWLVQMSRFHQICAEACNFYILKNRHANLIEQVETLIPEDQTQQYLIIRNALNAININTIAAISEEMSEDKQVEQIIKQQIPFCVNEFIQYMMDVSLDQFTVHWCGYTKQVLGAPFQQLEDYFARVNNAYYFELLKIPCDISKITFLFEKDLYFVCQQNYWRERIIARVINQTNNIVQSISQNKIKFNFKFRNQDEKIKRCNQKAKIPLFIQNQISRRLFQLQPIIQASQCIQMKSIETMDNSHSFGMSEQSQFYQDIQYRSDNQDNNFGGDNEFDSMSLSKSFMEDQSNQRKYSLDN